MNNKMILTMALAGGLLFSPSLAEKTFSQNESPRCPGLEALNRGNAMGLPGSSDQRRLEKALRQNMQSAQVMMRAAKKAGASNETLGEMGKLSANFMKLFVEAISQGQPPRGQGPQAAPQPAPRRPLPVRPAPKEQQPAPQIPSQGLIITAPDGTQWLVTPQAQPGAAPQTPQMVQPGQTQPGIPVIPPVPPTPGSQPSLQQPAAPSAQPLPEGVIILEEETVGELPKWPTKDQYAADGIMKYSQLLKAQENGMPVSEDLQFTARATPEGLVIVGEEMEEEKPEWPTKDQYAAEGMMQYVQDLKARGK